MNKARNLKSHLKDTIKNGTFKFKNYNTVLILLHRLKINTVLILLDRLENFKFLSDKRKKNPGYKIPG